MTTISDIDLVVHGGRIWTGNEDRPDLPDEVSAIAVRDGRVLAMGSDDEVAHLAAQAREVVDLRGRRAVPGLVDSHVHAVRAGVSWNRSLHWEDLRTLQAGLEQIRMRAAVVPAGTWISVVGGWHPCQLAERRGPTREELDAAAPEHPVYIQQMYDRAVLNSAALATCNWDGASADPPGGALMRDAAGRPTGEITGIGAFSVPLAQALAVDEDEARQGTKAMFRAFASHGLTGVHDGAGMLLTPEDYAPLYDLWREGELDMRVRLFLSPWSRGREVDEMAKVTLIARPDFGDRLLKVSGIGEVAHYGCHDLEGFEPFAPSEQDFAEFLDISRECVRAGWRMSIHAVLDESLTRVLDAWEQVEAETGLVAGRRFSIVHADQASERNLDRMARLGLGVLVQNRVMLKTAAYCDHPAWGPGDVERMPPLGAIRRRGLVLGAGSDATRANWYSPWASIWWLVTGRSWDEAPPRAPEHRLSRVEALAAYTRGGAWFTAEEDHRGRLAPGFDADLCVPTADPFSCAEEDLADIRSDLTVLSGRITHASGDFA